MVPTLKSSVRRLFKSFKGISLVLVITLGPGCGGGKDQQHPIGVPSGYWKGATKTIIADQGGTITTPNGTSLEIPPNALPVDTEVTVQPFRDASLGSSFIGGVRFEPEGVELLVPAVCRIPLHWAWDGNEEPLLYQFFGHDPSKFIYSGKYATLIGTPGAYLAEAEVTHFSGPMLARNCHAGTWQYVMASFRGRGCSHEEAMEVIRNYTDKDGKKPFKNTKLPDSSTAYCPASIEANKSGEETMQAFMKTYFHEVNSYNQGEDIADINKLLEYVRDGENGRNVVIAFTRDQWAERSDGLLKHVMHTATLELHNGQVKLRNSVSAPDDIVDALIDKNGDNVLWYPKEGELTADALNQFRQARTAEALETELCGQPGCLEDKSRNNLGIDRYKNMPLRNRTRPWTAMKIYVEYARSSENPCRTAETSLQASVSIPGHYSTVFVAQDELVGAYLTKITGGGDGIVLDKIPTVTGMSGINVMTDADMLTVTLNPSLAGAGIYTLLGSVFDLPDGTEAGVEFSTASIRDQSSVRIPVLFSATSGSVIVEEFGDEIGERLKGTFEVNILGERLVCEDPDCDDSHDEIITGTLNGSFNGVVKPESETSPRSFLYSTEDY